MEGYIKRFSELYDISGIKFEIVSGVLWRDYSGMIVPVGPVKKNYSISKEGAKFLLSKFSGALLVRSTGGFKKSENNFSQNEWYALICDKFSYIDELPSKNRNELRKGFKNFRVERIDAGYLADNGFPVYISAYKGYKGKPNPPMDEKFFKESILRTKNFSDIIHYYGVFFGSRLVAYAENFIYGNIEATYSMIKIHPDFLKLYPSYALIYEMNKFYLKENKFEYVNDGFRNIRHKTNIQQFLVDKFKFKPAYTNLNIFYRPFVRIFLSATYPVKQLLGGLNPKLSALYKLEEIRKYSNEK